MKPADVQEIVVKIIKKIAPDEHFSQLEPHIALREQLPLDSMDFLDIVMELRKEYKIEVPEADYGKLATLDSCAEYLLPKFLAKGAS